MVQASGVSLDDGACCINGCSRDVHARGMCRMHYDRWRRGGMGARKKRMSRACIQCGRFFETERRDKKTCSDRCRKAWNRKCRRSPVRLDSKPNPLKSVLWEPRANAHVDVPVPLPSLSGRAMTSGTRVLTRVLGAGWRLTGPLML